MLKWVGKCLESGGDAVAFGKSHSVRQGEAERKKSELKQAVEEMEKDQELLATAKTNNEFIRRLGELQAEQKTLEERKKEIEEIEVLRHRQKAATHEVHPAYRQWKTKADEILATKTEIERKKEKLTEAMETAQKRTGELSIAEQRRSTAEELQKKIDKINEEEEKYQQREKLGKMLAQLETSQKAIAEEESQHLVSTKEALDHRKQTTENTIIETRTTLKTLSNLSFSTWKEAGEARLEATETVANILNTIKKAENN